VIALSDVTRKCGRFVASAAQACWNRMPRQKRRWLLSGIVERVANRTADADLPSIFFPPDIRWYTTRFQRDHQMARALSELGCPVFFNEPTPHFSVPGLLSAKSKESCEDITQSLHLIRCPRFVYGDVIELVQPDVVIMVWPRHGALVPSGNNTFVVYDMCDDHALAGRRANDEFVRTHQKWIAAADVMVVTADRLLEAVRPQRPDAILLPNAVRPEDWELAGPPPSPKHLRRARQAPVVVGYYGAIGRWFNWDMWESAAKARPDWAFVLIGHHYDVQGARHLERAKVLPNVHFLGGKPYEQLKNYLWHFDVATIPFVLNAITQACSPVKLFEYMAAGKPIVTTRMQEVMKYKSVILADDNPDFVKKLEMALLLRDDGVYRSTLRAEAQANTWRSRAKALFEAIGAAREQGGGVPRRMTKSD